MTAGTYRIDRIEQGTAQIHDFLGLTREVFRGDRFRAGSDRARTVWTLASIGAVVIVVPVGKVWDRTADEPVQVDPVASAAMANDNVRAHVARACFNGGHDSAAESWARATVAQVAATGAACTVTVESRPGMVHPAVHVWTGEDADRLAGLAAAGMIDLHAGHVGCSAYCTCDAEAGADRPDFDRAARMAIDVNGQADTVRAIVKRRTGRPAWHALGMYRGDVLPSLLAYVADGTHGTARAQVAAIHRDLREQVTGYGCAAVWARQD